MGIYRVFNEITISDKLSKKNSNIKFNISKTTQHGPRIKLSIEGRSNSEGFSSFPVLYDNQLNDENDKDFDSLLDSSKINKELNEYSSYGAGFAVYGRKEILDVARAIENGSPYTEYKEKAIDKLSEFNRKIGSYKNTSMIRKVANAEREKRLKSI